MQIRQRLQRSGVSMTIERTIADAAQLMEVSGVGLVAVLDGDQLTGVVTDRDLVRRGIARGYATDARVDSVMSAPVHTISANADVHEAYEKFREHAVRRLVVMDGAEFVGILSLDDLLIDLATELVALSTPFASEVAFPHRDAKPPAVVE